MGKTRRYSPEPDYEVVEHRERGRRPVRLLSKKAAAKIARGLPVVQVPVKVPRITMQEWIPPRSESAQQERVRDYRLDLLQELGEQMLLGAQDA